MSNQIMMVILPLYSFGEESPLIKKFHFQVRKLFENDGITISQIITSFINLEGYWDDV